MTPELFSYVEDAPSREVAIRLVAHVNENRKTPLAFRAGFPAIKNGFGNIKSMVPALLKMTRNGVPCFVLTDLDRHPCPSALLQDWIAGPGKTLPELPAGFLLRIAVREVEAWIMADREAFAHFMTIPAANFNAPPETLPDPKEELLNIIRAKGKKPWHKKMLPACPTANIGPLYNEKICEFIRMNWDPGRAASNAPSLARALLALRRLP